MERGGAVYFMTNKSNTTIYVGVTSKLKERIYSHKNNLIPDSFTARYKLHKFVYYEMFHSIEEAITREKQIKAGPRSKKVELINGLNPEWLDLFDEILNW